MGDRLLIDPKEHVRPDEIAFKDQTDIAKAAHRAGLMPFAQACPSGVTWAHSTRRPTEPSDCVRVAIRELGGS